MMTAWRAGSGLLLLALAANAEDLAGRVIAVSDGDTLTVRVDGQRPVKVRLAGIDAPERDQPFGQRRRQSLSELAFGQPATVMVQKIDDYGRTVGTVTVGGVNVEAEQVRRGLWADTNPLPPWAWRHGEKAAITPEPAPARTDFAGRCGAKRTCGAMTSGAEARFY